MKKKNLAMLGVASATIGTATVGAMFPGGAAFADDPVDSYSGGTETEYTVETDTRSSTQRASSWNRCYTGYFCLFSGAWGSGDMDNFYPNRLGALPANPDGYYCSSWKNCASSLWNRTGHNTYTAVNSNGTGSPEGWYHDQWANLGSILNDNIEYADT